MLTRLRPEKKKTNKTFLLSYPVQLCQIQLISLSNIRKFNVVLFCFFSLIHNFFSLSIFFFFLVHSLPPTCLSPLLLLFRDQSWANSITLIRCNLRSIPSISILSVRTSGNPRKRGKLIQTPAKMSEHG